MAVVSAPGARRSLVGAALAAAASRARVKGRAGKAVAAVRENVMTFAGLAAIDTGMFHLGVVAGWVAVGVSVLLADFRIQG